LIPVWVTKKVLVRKILNSKNFSTELSFFVGGDTDGLM